MNRTQRQNNRLSENLSSDAPSTNASVNCSAHPANTASMNSSARWIMGLWTAFAGVTRPPVAARWQSAHQVAVPIVQQPPQSHLITPRMVDRHHCFYPRPPNKGTRVCCNTPFRKSCSHNRYRP